MATSYSHLKIPKEMLGSFHTITKPRLDRKLSSYKVFNVFVSHGGLVLLVSVLLLRMHGTTHDARERRITSDIVSAGG